MKKNQVTLAITVSVMTHLLLQQPVFANNCNHNGKKVWLKEISTLLSSAFYNSASIADLQPGTLVEVLPTDASDAIRYHRVRVRLPDRIIEGYISNWSLNRLQNFDIAKEDDDRYIDVNIFNDPNTVREMKRGMTPEEKRRNGLSR